MIIIALSGKLNSGKDTVGSIIQYLVSEPNRIKTGYDISYNDFVNEAWNEESLSGFKIKKFATKLKKRIAITWGIKISDLENREFKESMSPLGITWRKLMQLEGEKMREIDEDYWVKALMNSISNNCIITDLRFPNEAKAIKEKNGIAIRINRPCKECNNLNKHKLDCNIGRFEHISETSLDDYNDWEYIIDNDRGIEELILKMKVILIKENII